MHAAGFPLHSGALVGHRDTLVWGCAGEASFTNAYFSVGDSTRDSPWGPSREMVYHNICSDMLLCMIAFCDAFRMFRYTMV